MHVSFLRISILFIACLCLNAYAFSVEAQTDKSVPAQLTIVQNINDSWRQGDAETVVILAQQYKQDIYRLQDLQQREKLLEIWLSALFRLRQIEKALSATQEWYSRWPTATAVVHMWGKAKHRNGMASSSIYAKQQEYLDTHPEGFDEEKMTNCFWWGFSVYVDNHFDSARGIWNQCIEKLTPSKTHISKTFYERLLWYRAWSAFWVATFESTDWDRDDPAYSHQAIVLLKELAQQRQSSFSDSMIPIRARYWWGRLLWQQGKLQEAKLVWKSLPKQKNIETKWYAYWIDNLQHDSYDKKKEDVAAEKRQQDPFDNLLQECQETTVPKHWLKAIMLAESGGQEKIQSIVGAQGVMQLMPNIASSIIYDTWKLSVSRQKIETYLHNGSLNVQFACRLLQRHQHDFGQLHKVAAAYNAGADMVHTWDEQFGDLPTDVWIERIPFLETRQYVKKVMVYAADASLFNPEQSKMIDKSTTHEPYVPSPWSCWNNESLL